MSKYELSEMQMYGCGKDFCKHDWIYIGSHDGDGYNIPDYPFGQIEIFEIYRCRLCGEYDERNATIGKKRVVK